MTNEEIKTIVDQVVAIIKESSTDVTELKKAVSLNGLSGLPAMQGEELVLAPIPLLSAPAEIAATEANKQAKAASDAAALAGAAAENANDAAEMAQQAMLSAVTLQRYKGADTQSSAMTDPMILLGTFTPADGETTADFTTRVNQAINSTFGLTAGVANEKYCGTMRLIVNSQNIELRQYVRSYANGQYVQVISGTVGLGSAGQIVFSQQNYAVYWRAIDQGVAGQWQAYASGDVPEIDEATETTAGLLSPEDKQKLNQIDPDNLLSTQDKEKLNLMGIWTFSSEGLKFLTVPDILMAGGLKVNGDITFGTGLGNNGYIHCPGDGTMKLVSSNDTGATLHLGGNSTATYNGVMIADGKLHLTQGIDFNDPAGATDGKISWNTDGVNISVGSSRNITIGDKTKVNIAVSQTDVKIKDGKTNDDLVIIDHSDMPEDHTGAVSGQVTVSDLSCRLFSLGKIINKSYYAMEYPAFGATMADYVGFNAPIIVGRDGHMGIEFSNANEENLYSMGMGALGSTDTDLTIDDIGGDLQIRMSQANQHIKLYAYGGTLTLTDANTKINNELDVEIAGKNVLRANKDNIAISATDISLSGQTEIAGKTTINGQTEIAGTGLTVKSAANFTGNVQCTQDMQVLGNLLAQNLTLSSAINGYPQITPAGTNLGGLKITLLKNDPLQVTDTDNTTLLTLGTTNTTIGKPLTVSGTITSSGATINGQTTIAGNLSCNGTINLGTIMGAANIKGTITTIFGDTRVVLDSATVNIGQPGGETTVNSPLHCNNSITLQDNIYIGSTGFTISTDKIEKPQNTGEFKIQADAVKILTLGTTGLNLDGLSLIADPQTNTLTILNPLTAKQLTLQLQ